MGLLRHFSPIAASLILGVFWALWHIPFFIIDYYGSNFLWFSFDVIGLSFIMSWLYFNSRWSVWPVMLLHAGTNIISSFTPTSGLIFEIEDSFSLVRGVIYWVLALIIILFTKGKLGINSKQSISLNSDI